MNTVPLAQYEALSSKLQVLQTKAAILYNAFIHKGSYEQLLAAIDLHDALKETENKLVPPECRVISNNGAKDTSVINKALPVGADLYLASWLRMTAVEDLKLKLRASEIYQGRDLNKIDEAHRQAYAEMQIC